MTKKFQIPSEEAKKVEEFFKEKDDHAEAAHKLRSAISTGSGYIGRARFYDGLEKPSSDSSAITITPSRHNRLALVYLKHWPHHINNPVAIFNDSDEAKEAIRKAAKEWNFLL